MKLASLCSGFYAIVLSKVEGAPFITMVLYKAETRNTHMSWNPNQGQDPNQPSQYGGYSPPPSQPQPQPTDPYSGQQAGYGQQGGYGEQQQGGQYPRPCARSATPAGINLDCGFGTVCSVEKTVIVAKR